MSYSRILLPIDGSALALHAVAETVSIAAAFGATVVALEVVDTPAVLAVRLPPTHAVMEECLPATLDADSRLAHEDVRRVGDLIRPEVLLVDERVVGGLAGPTILSVAQDEGCDLIVMCTHGKGGRGRGKLGTVTDYVVRHSTISVLITTPTM